MPPSLFDRLHGALADLLRLIDRTRDEEAEIAARLGRLEQETHAEFTKAFEERKRQRDDEVASLDQAHQEKVAALEKAHAREKEAEAKSSAEALEQLKEEEQAAGKQLQTELREALWTAGALLEGGQKQVKEEQEALRRSVEQAQEEAEQIRAQLHPLLERYSIDPESLAPKKKAPAAAGE